MKRRSVSSLLSTEMKKFTMKTLLCYTILAFQSEHAWSKPGGEYGTFGDYGAAEIGGAYQTLPDNSGVLTNTDLKPASTYDIGYGSPFPEKIVPAVFPIRSLGWGLKQPILPEPFIAPIQIIAKPVPFPVHIPVGWEWQGPGIF